jgi:hypothetical protein
MATDAKTERAPVMHKAAINVLHERMPIYLCAERAAIPAPRRFATPSYRPAKTLEDVFRSGQPECARVNTGYSII